MKEKSRKSSVRQKLKLSLENDKEIDKSTAKDKEASASQVPNSQGRDSNQAKRMDELIKH